MMQRRRRRFALIVVCMTTFLAGPWMSAAADQSGIRPLKGEEKREFFEDVGWDPPLKCVYVGVSRSDERWALAAPSGKCGENSGHNYVYKKNRNGVWKFKFYDMESDGCDRFNMPQSVREDFTPYVC